MEVGKTALDAYENVSDIVDNMIAVRGFDYAMLAVAYASHVILQSSICAAHAAASQGAVDALHEESHTLDISLSFSIAEILEHNDHDIEAFRNDAMMIVRARNAGAK